MTPNELDFMLVNLYFNEQHSCSLRHHISIRPEVLQMLDLIYSNVCCRPLDDSIAGIRFSAIEQAILSLDTMPQRGAEITTGVFANK